MRRSALFQEGYFTLFLIVAIGILLGKMRIAPISLDVSAVIFAALALAHLGASVDQHARPGRARFHERIERRADCVRHGLSHRLAGDDRGVSDHRAIVSLQITRTCSPQSCSSIRPPRQSLTRSLPRRGDVSETEVDFLPMVRDDTPPVRPFNSSATIGGGKGQVEGDSDCTNMAKTCHKPLRRPIAFDRVFP